ncbi:hypothetical protein AALA69_00105 [Eggerthellaceae bacterium 24-137]
MSNQSRYRAMMGEVHASADLIGKVKGIPMEKTKKRGVALRLATATCAGLLGVFVVTNGVCYAATGETWVEKATVWVNGEPVEMDVQMTQDGDVTVGTVEYTVEDADGAGGDVAVTMSAEGGDFSGTTYEIRDYAAEGAGASSAAGAMVLESDDGHVLLAPGDGSEVEPIDITDQLAAKGAATGTYEAGGTTYVYQVSGETGSWNVSVEAEGDAAAEVAPAASVEAQ